MTGVDVLMRTIPSLVAIVGALLLLRHWAQRGGAGCDAGVRVISRTGLVKGAVVAVVAVGRRRLLVAASEHGVVLLDELEPVELTTTGSDPSGAEPRTSPISGTTRLRELAHRRASGLALTTTDRPRMAPLDRLRHLTVRRPVPRHPRRPDRVPHQT